MPLNKKNPYFILEHPFKKINMINLHLHVGVWVVEGDPAWPDGILVLVCVEAGVHHAAKQLVEDHSQTLFNKVTFGFDRKKKKLQFAGINILAIYLYEA